VIVSTGVTIAEDLSPTVSSLRLMQPRKTTPRLQKSFKSLTTPEREEKKSKTIDNTFPDDSEMTAKEADGLRRTVNSSGAVQLDGNEEEQDRPDHNIGDLEGAIITNVDFWMDEVYGDHVHQNSGHYLDGDISNDTEWQNHWRRLVVYYSQTYMMHQKARLDASLLKRSQG
jgi:hypothetical protein